MSENARIVMRTKSCFARNLVMSSTSVFLDICREVPLHQTWPEEEKSFASVRRLDDPAIGGKAIPTFLWGRGYGE